jgi:hypothetical protein
MPDESTPLASKAIGGTDEPRAAPMRRRETAASAPPSRRDVDQMHAEDP